MKTFFTLIMLSFISFNSFAEDRIYFEQLHQKGNPAKANCQSRETRSSSDLVKQTSSYRALITPRFFDRLLDQSHFISLEHLQSPVTVYALGSESMSLVESSEIEVQFKTPDNEVILSTLFFWADSPKEILSQQKGHAEHFEAYYQGPANCSAYGPRFQLKRCRFSIPFSMAESLDHQMELIERYTEIYPGEGLIIEVHYRNTLYTECTSTQAQSSARGVGSSPKLYLRKAK